MSYKHNHPLTLNGHPLDCVGDEAQPPGPHNHRLCWQTETSIEHAIHFGVKSAAVVGPCIHLGKRTGDYAPCADGCNGDAKPVEVRTCDVHGTCTQARRGRDVPGCCRNSAGLTCPDWQTVGPLKFTPIDSARLAPSYDNTKFNASILRYRDYLLMAYRCGQGGSQIHVAHLGDDLQPTHSEMLGLMHPLSLNSREDPRLFVYRDRLHCSFIGVLGDPGNGKPGNTHQLYARLTDDLPVEEIFYPYYPQRHPTWEKNWTFFDHDGQLYTIYSTQPHVVLRVNDDMTTEIAGNEPFTLPWHGGLIRGGASPVRVGDEYWCWVHGKANRGHPTPTGRATTTVYSLGLYTFDAAPPFAPRRIIEQPLVWGDERTRGSCWCAVVFPCGATRDGDRWLVSAGIHDTTISVFEFSHRHLERSLR